jgi:hypothetical protein
VNVRSLRSRRASYRLFEKKIQCDRDTGVTPIQRDTFGGPLRSGQPRRNADAQCGESARAPRCVPPPARRFRRHQHQFTGEHRAVRLTAGSADAATDRYEGNPFQGEFKDYDLGLQDHVLVTSYQLEIPNGGGLLGGSALARGFLDGWRFSGISTFATGAWSDFTGGGESCDGSGSQPFHMVGDPMANAPKTESRWFNPSVFQPAGGRGDLGNDAACNNRKIQLPGFHNHDVTFFKDFNVRGNQRLTFKWEVANLFVAERGHVGPVQPEHGRADRRQLRTRDCGPERATDGVLAAVHLLRTRRTGQRRALPCAALEKYRTRPIGLRG